MITNLPRSILSALTLEKTEVYSSCCCKILWNVVEWSIVCFFYLSFVSLLLVFIFLTNAFNGFLIVPVFFPPLWLICPCLLFDFDFCSVTYSWLMGLSHTICIWDLTPHFTFLIMTNCIKSVSTDKKEIKPIYSNELWAPLYWGNLLFK